MRGKFIWLLAIVLACSTAVFIACESSDVNLTGPTGSSEPTQPGIFDQSTTDNGGDDSPSSDEEPIDIKGKLNKAQLNAGSLTAVCKVPRTQGKKIYLGAFRVTETQHAIGDPVSTKKSPAILEKDLPCETLVQVDCVWGEPPVPNNIDANKLIDAWIGTTGACSPPPPPPPPPPGCVPPPDPSTIPCECGDCGECPELKCVFDEEACAWKCEPIDPPCDPGPPPSEGCQLNEQTCAWKCPPPECEPHGEPECDEQVWDTELCEWVGECEPECDEEELTAVAEAECEFGFDLDLDACEFTCFPPPEEGDCPETEGIVDFCHVSSKKNGAINEKNQTGHNGIPPGHCAHFNPDKWNPVDYLGQCDGRSFPD